jgi:hypothetical protein
MQYIGTARLGIMQNVAYTGTAGVIANPIGAETYKVRVVVTTDAFVTTDGTTPSSTNGAYVPGLTAEYFTTTPGQKVSAVQVSAGGTLYVTECL